MPNIAGSKEKQFKVATQFIPDYSQSMLACELDDFGIGPGATMRTMIKADDGDQLTVRADDLSIEQLAVCIEVENPAYNQNEADCIMLSTDSARELGRALIEAADLVELCARQSCGLDYVEFVKGTN